MKSSTELQKSINAIHRKSYPAYKSLQGTYDFPGYHLSIDHVQGDPFASPSRLSVLIPHKSVGFPEEYYGKDHRRIALEDFILRVFSSQLGQYSFKAKGSGKSGIFSTSKPGQEMLSRTACEVAKEGIFLRFEAGFPANGRTINAQELEKMLFQFLPKCIKQIFFRNLDKTALEEQIFLSDDQLKIREYLKEHGLCAFVGNGSILPRQSGISDRPLKDAVLFQSPSSLEVSIALPHRGTLKGLGIRNGITLIAGGGYHGKSTLLNALELGVYNHIAGDGREYVITDDSAVKLRAEDGRCIKNVDISLFINDLPNKKDTCQFSTENASGSTSQAANVVEGMEAGSRLFLIDEDTSATNFMVRDEFMQQVIKRDKEPITPFIERAMDLFSENRISTVLVAGSSGAYFHIADTVIQMDNYKPLDITNHVKKLCKEYPAPSVHAPGYHFPAQKRSVFAKNSRQKDFLKLKIMGRDGFSIDKNMVELRYVEQLADSEQSAALGYILKYLLENNKTGADVVHTVDMIEKKIREEGLKFLCGRYAFCGLAMPRRQEIFACLNRYRTF